MATINLTDADFDSTVSEGIVLVDFWAEWCGPCKMFAPIYEQVSENHPDITFAKVDTEESRGLAAKYRIMSIPTLMAFKEGELVFAQPGALPAASLEQLVAKLRELDMDEVRQQLAEQEASE